MQEIVPNAGGARNIEKEFLEMENEIKTKESRGVKESRQYRKFKDI